VQKFLIINQQHKPDLQRSSIFKDNSKMHGYVHIWPHF